MARLFPLLGVAHGVLDFYGKETTAERYLSFPRDHAQFLYVYYEVYDSGWLVGLVGKAMDNKTRNNLISVF